MTASLTLAFSAITLVSRISSSCVHVGTKGGRACFLFFFFLGRGGGAETRRIQIWQRDDDDGDDFLKWRSRLGQEDILKLFYCI